MIAVLCLCAKLTAQEKVQFGATPGYYSTHRGGEIDSAITDLINLQIVNVKSNGATGDGITDDAAAIQASINLAGPGKMVYVPSGRYNLGSTTLRMKTGVAFIMQDGATIIKTTSGYIFSIGRDSLITIQGGRIIGLSSVTTQYAAYVDSGSTHIRLTGVTFDSLGGYGLFFKGRVGLPTRDILVDKCRFLYSYYPAIRLESNVRDVTIQNCTQYNTSTEGNFVQGNWWYPPEDINLNNILIQGNTVLRCERMPVEFFNTENLKILNNSLLGVGIQSYAISIPTARGALVRGNRIQNDYRNVSAYGIELFNNDRTVIEGNVIDGKFASAIDLNASSGTNDDIKILNNMIRMDSTTVLPSGSMHGIAVVGNPTYSMRNLLIQGNTLTNAGVFPINLATSGGFAGLNISNNTLHMDSLGGGYGISVSMARNGIISGNVVRFSGTSAADAGIRLNADTSLFVYRNVLRMTTSTGKDTVRGSWVPLSIDPSCSAVDTGWTLPGVISSFNVNSAETGIFGIVPNIRLWNTNTTAANFSAIYHYNPAGAPKAGIEFVNSNAPDSALIRFPIDYGTRFTIKGNGDAIIPGVATIGSLSGTVRATAGVLSATPSDTVGLAAALASKVGGSSAVLDNPVITSTLKLFTGAGTLRSASDGYVSSTASDTVGLASALAGKLSSADSTTLKNSVLSQVLKNADSTTLKNSVLSQVLKNADSTTLKNSVLSQTLKNADSTSMRNYSGVLYKKKADVIAYFGCGADSANTTTWDKFPMGVLPVTVVVDSVHFICSYTTAPNFTPTISYGPNINAAGTSLGSYSAVTVMHTTSAVGYGTSIAAGNDVWVVWGTITTLPRRWAVTIWGHQ